MSSAKDALKSECQALKSADPSIPFRLIPSTSATAPFPLTLTIRVPQPESCHMFDIFELIFNLTIPSFDAYTATITMDHAPNGIDKSLAAGIQKAIAVEYKKLSTKNKESWRLKEICAFVTTNYRQLIMSVNGTLDAYMGEDAEGKSMRRWAPLILPEATKQETDEEEQARKQKEEEEAAEYWRRKKLEEEEAELERKRKEAEERRLEAERDPSLFEKPRQLSKKELEERAAERDKQGKRLRKTGPNKTKFDPEAHAARKEARGEK
ncbi:hypothetical protein HDU99_003145 [Rhizoclosmatium hyalinum]|nr:hypothetical protein HDU99_003145 [Rhizoclosmatium hyalinum]